MLTRIGEFFLFIFALIASVAEIRTSGKVYKPASEEDKIAFVVENQETFDSIADYLIDNSLGSFFIYNLEREANIETEDIDSLLQDRILVRNYDDNCIIEFKFMTGTLEGYSDSGFYYSQNGELEVRSWEDEPVYDAESGSYTKKVKDVTTKIIPINEHWYFTEKSYASSTYNRMKEEKDK